MVLEPEPIPLVEPVEPVVPVPEAPPLELPMPVLAPEPVVPVLEEPVPVVLPVPVEDPALEEPFAWRSRQSCSCVPVRPVQLTELEPLVDDGEVVELELDGVLELPADELPEVELSLEELPAELEGEL